MSLRFMNSSVVSADLSLGWNSQESRAVIRLADDPAVDDYFTPNDPGIPAIFECGSLTFVGLMENWKRDDSISGYPVYEVNLVDPRVLFDGVNIILGDYYGPVYTNNTMNVFGYYENTVGFGGSQRNSVGIPWRKIIQGINSIQSTDTRYGRKMSYRNISYTLDLSGLPSLPDYYRIGGSPSITLMQLIMDICQTANCDFSVTLDSSLTIGIIPISRNIPIIRGGISKYIASTENVSSRSFGEEMVNETCSKMLIGGKRAGVILVTYGTGPDDDIDKREDNPIEQYWGAYEDGTVVVPVGKHKVFELDSRNVIAGNVGYTYKTDVEEMRAALDSQSSWESWLWLRCMHKYYMEHDGTETDYIYEITVDSNGDNVFKKTEIEYKHKGEKNPHFRKAFDLDLKSGVEENITKFLMNSSVDEILRTNFSRFSKTTFLNVQNPEVDVADRLYAYVKAYADEHYGKKYMVIAPDVNVAMDSETSDIYYSHLPTQLGYLSENVFKNAVKSKILPVEVFRLQSDDNRIHPYVRFDNKPPTQKEPDARICSFENISNDDVLYGIDYNRDKNVLKGSVFIKCEISDSYVYLDGETFESPRVVLTLPGRVLEYIDDDSDGPKNAAIMTTYLKIIAQNKGWTDAQRDKIIDMFIKNHLNDFKMLRAIRNAVPPNLAAITLESQTETYGPWYSNIADGRCEVEVSEDLVPWNFLTYQKMNEAGLARVNEIIGTMQFSESGSVELPGYPTINLGAALIASGPAVTDISINMSTDGVLTTYRMQSWTPSFGKLSRYNQERLQRVDKLKMEINKNIKEKFSNQLRKITGQ